jgi:hypothetical protein
MGDRSHDDPRYAGKWLPVMIAEQLVRDRAAAASASPRLGPMTDRLTGHVTGVLIRCGFARKGS